MGYAMLLLVVLCLPLNALALPETLRFQRLGLEHGLSQSSILCSAMDRRGFLWFGTYDGLNRYDGYDFKVYRKGDEPGALTDSVIRALLVDQGGTLWVGTSPGGLNRYDDATDSFSALRHDPHNPASLPSDEVYALTDDGRGGLWVGTAKGLARVEASGAVTRFQNPSGGETPIDLTATAVWALALDEQGALWVGSELGLSRLAPDGTTVEHYVHVPEDPSSIPPGSVRSLLPESGGTLWAGVLEGGLGRLDVAKGTWETFFPGTWVLALFRDSRDILWAGTERGLARLVRDGNSATPDAGESFLLYSHNPFDPESLSHNDIYTILEDRSGILWVGTFTEGICKLVPDAQEFRVIRQEPWKEETLSDRSVRSVLQDPRGRLWLGTTYGGLNLYDPATGQVRVFKPDPEDPASFPSVEIRALSYDPEGYIWVGTADVGVLRLDPETGEYLQYTQRPDDPNSLSHFNVYNMYDDGKGSLWIGFSRAGLNRLDKRTGEVTRWKADAEKPHSLSHNRVRNFLEHGGFFWLGTSKGLNRLDPATGQFEHWAFDPANPQGILDDRVTALLPGDTEDTLWVGTHKGLTRFHIAEQRFEHFTTAQGFPFAGEAVAALQRDKDGVLWVATLRGLSRFDPASGEVRNYSPREGLQGYNFLENSTFKNAKGELFFGGLQGLTWFDPERILPNTHRPPVVFTDLRVMNRPLALGRNLADLDKLTLSYKDLFFTFAFAALDFANPTRNRYAYMLEGFDQEWVDNAYARTATYTNLAPGSYVFRVRAANSDGYWNEDGLRLQLVILPPFWQTNWFRALVLLTVIVLLYLLHRGRVRQLEVRRRLLERQVAERTEELARTYGQLQGIMDHSPSAIALKDLEGRYLQVNPQYESFFGLPRDQVLGRTPAQLFDAATAEVLLTSHRDVCQEGAGQTLELQVAGRTLLVQQFALSHADKEPYALCSIATDISARKVAEDALKASETRYRTLAANFPDGIVGLFDHSLRFILADGTELAGLGLSTADVLGRTVADLTPPEIAEPNMRLYREALAGQSGFLELVYQGKDFEVRTLPILDERGQVQAGMVVILNVTKRKAAERARQEAEHIYRSITELSPEAIFVHGPEGILFANPAAVALLEVANTEALQGRQLTALAPESEASRMMDQFDAAREGRGPTNLVEVLLGQDEGRLRNVEMVSVPIVYGTNEALLTIARDVTDKKRLMAEAMRSAQLVSLGELAAGVAHEINNPINGIINFAELLRDDPKKQLTYPDLPERIIKEGDRIAGIVRTLLNFAKGQDDTLALAPLQDVLQDALHLCRNQLNKEGVSLSLELEPDLPQFFGKPSEMQQVFINCIANSRAALQDKPAGEKRLLVRMESFQGAAPGQPDTGRTHPWLRLVFEDNGVGIPPEIMPRIFEPFFSTKPRNKGTGLGLSISHRIVQDHRGRMVFTSEPGQWTRAVIEVPAWQSERGAKR